MSDAYATIEMLNPVDAVPGGRCESSALDGDAPEESIMIGTSLVRADVIGGQAAEIVSIMLLRGCPFTFRRFCQLMTTHDQILNRYSLSSDGDTLWC